MIRPFCPKFLCYFFSSPIIAAHTITISANAKRNAIFLVLVASLHILLDIYDLLIFLDSAYQKFTSI